MSYSVAAQSVCQYGMTQAHPDIDAPVPRARPERHDAPVATPTDSFAPTTFPDLPVPDAPTASGDPPGPDPLAIHSVSLVVLTVFATLFVLQWAKVVFIPVMLGVLASYALSPMVNWMEQKRVPRWFSSAVLLLSLVGAAGWAGYALSDQAAKLMESLPAAAQKFRQSVKMGDSVPGNALETVQKAAAQIEQAAQESSAATVAAVAPAGGSGKGTPRAAMRVVVEQPRFNIRDYLWTGTLGVAFFLGQAIVIVFLTYFLMLSGDTFRRKLIKLAGPRLSSKKITLQALHEITEQIQRYLQVQLFISALVGVLTWLALLAIGLENPAVWGVAAGVLNFVPYAGSLVMAGASGMVGFLQFGSLNMALAVAGASLVIHMVVGNLLTPWLTSRTSRISPVAVFVGLLAWGWLWGLWGLLLGVPILMIVKSVCDRVEGLKPIGEFLGS